MAEQQKPPLFDSLIRGPEIILGLQDRFLTGQPGPDFRAELEDFFEGAGYRLSKRQRAIIKDNAGLFAQARNNSLTACRVKEAKPGYLRHACARRFRVMPELIDDVEVAPTSITVVLEDAAFCHAARRLTGNDGLPDSYYRSRGLAYKDKYVKIIDPLVVLPVSLVRIDQRGIRDHESGHHNYTYTRPRPKTMSWEQYQGYLKGQITGCIRLHNVDRFRTFAGSIRTFMVTSYLKELYAYAIQGCPGVAYGQIFGSPEKYYPFLFAQRVELLQSFLPADPQERAEWEAIIREELAMAQTQAAYINDRILQLAKSGISPSRLAAIVAFLTPDQGYLVNVFCQDEPFDLSQKRKLRQWKQEYNQGPSKAQEDQ